VIGYIRTDGVGQEPLSGLKEAYGLEQGRMDVLDLEGIDDDLELEVEGMETGMTSGIRGRGE